MERSEPGRRLARHGAGGYACALALGYGLMFLWGSQSAVNYYYLVGTVQLMGALFLSRPAAEGAA